ncbi:MAG: polysaccharide deacetylase family protein [Candidatus Omnitrophica bacterium]|nr:polysaccharide deacetylase family protein [Candidatus Omnitrophota bacterium]
MEKPNSPNYYKKLFWIIGGALLAVILAVTGLFILKRAQKINCSDDPYLLLKNYNSQCETITKSKFEELFSNGDEIFDWLMKNNYFEEKNGTSVHPRFVSPDERLNIGHRFYADHERILALLQQANSSRHEFVLKSAEISSQMAYRAIEALKRKNIEEAIKDCNISIDLFPLDAKPYILLAKLYLMTGREMELYETLTLAGRSYPNFNNIVGIIDDEDLDNIPLEEPKDNIYLADFPENKKMAISFMFDDGERDSYVNALPIFEKYGYRATFPIIAGFTGENSDPFWGSWAQWRDAANRGFEIANHSMYHRDSRDLHGSDFDVSIDQAKDMIEKNTGHKVTAYVFPHDSYSDEAVSRALREHEVIRTPEFLHSFYNREVSIVYGGPFFSVETANRLVDIGIKRFLWIVACCHGVTTRRGILSFKSVTPSFLEKHLSYIHSKSNEIWVDTFSKVFEYMAQRAHAKIETRSSAAGSIDFVLHSDNPKEKLSVPLTVVVKEPEGANFKSAVGRDNHPLKAWSCAASKLCVDVDAYEENVHVEWN